MFRYFWILLSCQHFFWNCLLRHKRCKHFGNYRQEFTLYAYHRQSTSSTGSAPSTGRVAASFTDCCHHPAPLTPRHTAFLPPICRSRSPQLITHYVVPLKNTHTYTLLNTSTYWCDTSHTQFFSHFGILLRVHHSKSNVFVLQDLRSELKVHTDKCQQEWVKIFLNNISKSPPHIKVKSSFWNPRCKVQVLKRSLHFVLGKHMQSPYFYCCPHLQWSQFMHFISTEEQYCPLGLWIQGKSYIRAAWGAKYRFRTAEPRMVCCFSYCVNCQTNPLFSSFWFIVTHYSFIEQAINSKGPTNGPWWWKMGMKKKNRSPIAAAVDPQNTYRNTVPTKHVFDINQGDRWTVAQ